MRTKQPLSYPSDEGRKLTRQEKHKLRLSKKINGYGPYRERTEDCVLGCGGQAVWCSCCECYTSTCCVDYGTCLCS